MLRLWALVVLFGSLTISGYYRARARKLSGTIERRREGGLALAARAAGGLGAFGSILAHALVPGVMGWASFRAPDWVAWTGATVGLFVIPGTYWVFSSIGRNVSETVLTKDAPRPGSTRSVSLDTTSALHGGRPCCYSRSG